MLQSASVVSRAVEQTMLKGMNYCGGIVTVTSARSAVSLHHICAHLYGASVTPLIDINFEVSTDSSKPIAYVAYAAN